MSDPLDTSLAQLEVLPEAEAQATLQAWVKARRAGLPEAAAGSGHKPTARLGKKALYQLRSSGVALAQPPRPAEAPAPAPPPSELPVVLSPILGTGERALFLARPKASGGVETYSVIVSDVLGVLQLERGEAARGEYKRYLKQLREGRTFLEVSLARAAQLLGEAFALNEATRTPLPAGAQDALLRLGVVPGTPAPVPAAEPGDAALAQRGAELHQSPELSQWLPPEEFIRALGERLAAVAESPLALSPAQKQEQQRAKVALTAAEFLTPAFRALYARRLWEMGALFEATGRAPLAQLAQASARTLAHGARGDRFVEAMFEKVVSLSEAAQDRARAQSGGLPPPPGMREPGSLILP